MTIRSANEFVRLRLSDAPADYNRAAHDDAPDHVWDDVIESRPDMRAWVAHNKTVPLEILARLAEDDDPAVRSAVAMKRKLSRELFDALAADPDPSVRARVAVNAKVPRRVLETLARDDEPLVADAATERL